MTKRLRRTIKITIIETWTLRWGDPAKATERGYTEGCLTGDEVAQEANADSCSCQAHVMQFIRRSSSYTTLPISSEQEDQLIEKSILSLTESSSP